MRLKDILLEREDKWVRKLNTKVQNGDWNIREPEVYRGRRTDNKPVMEKQTTGGREPRDTSEKVDNMINIFHEECYSPEFPPRDECRFGTTDKKYAHEFTPDEGGDIYVIIPFSSETTYYYRSEDPAEIFDTIDYLLTKFKYKFRTWWQESGRENWTNYPDDLMHLADFLKDVVESNIVDPSFIQAVGCPSRLNNKITDWKEEVFSRNESLDSLPDWVHYLEDIIAAIYRYFSELRTEWPNSVDKGDELTIHGKYLQVEESVYLEWKKRYY